MEYLIRIELSITILMTTSKQRLKMNLNLFFVLYTLRTEKLREFVGNSESMMRAIVEQTSTKNEN